MKITQRLAVSFLSLLEKVNLNSMCIKLGVQKERCKDRNVHLAIPFFDKVFKSTLKSCVLLSPFQPSPLISTLWT